MSNRRFYLKFLFPVVWIIFVFPGLIHTQNHYKSAGLEQLTIAVPDLFVASRFFSDSLGFTIKLGRLHKNSIENSHVKFRDKSSIELITAESPLDDLAVWYLKYLRQFPAGAEAFVGIRIDDEAGMNEVEKKIMELGLDYKRLDFQYSDIIYFGQEVPVNTLFFIRYKIDVKDSPAILKHENTANGLNSVWINSARPEEAAKLLQKFGFNMRKTKNLVVGYPAEFRVIVGDKTVYFVDSEREERIAGVSIKCSDLGKFRKLYKTKTGESVSIKEGYDGNYILPDERDRCGMWIEFIE